MMTNPGNRVTQGQFSFLPDLTDAQIEALKTTVSQIMKRNSSLGLIFLYLFGIVLLVFLGLFFR